MESKAIRSLADLLEDANTGQEMVDLWEEYEKAETAEAKAVKDLDKFDMILQVKRCEFGDSLVRKSSFGALQLLNYVDFILTGI